VFGYIVICNDFRVPENVYKAYETLKKCALESKHLIWMIENCTRSGEKALKSGTKCIKITRSRLLLSFVLDKKNHKLKLKTLLASILFGVRKRFKTRNTLFGGSVGKV